MSKKDWDKLAAYEKAISKKYGTEAIQNPKSNWDEEKERDYIEQQKLLYKKEIGIREAMEKVDHEGILISKKLLNRDSRYPCPVCHKMFHKAMDDVCITKYDCCFGCYVKWVEGREERWQKGWRPDEIHNKTDQTDN